MPYYQVRHLKREGGGEEREGGREKDREGGKGGKGGGVTDSYMVVTVAGAVVWCPNQS